MRRVLPRDTVAHYWAHRVQDDARDKQHSFYFVGPTLYSYGPHFVIGHILTDGRVLWNDSSYSVTTSKHQSIARRAMTRQQRETMLYFPDLSSDDARAITRAIDEKRLPEYASKLIRQVQSDVASIIGKRKGSGPFCSALYDARRYDATARALYAAAGKKYPLDVIPENVDIPVDKTARVAFVAAFSRAVIIDDYQSALRQAGNYLATARSEATSADGTQYDDPHTRARIAGGTYDCAERGLKACDDADRHHRVLHGKASPQAGKLRKALQPIAAEFKARQHAAEIEVMRARLQRFAQSFYRHLHADRKHARASGHARSSALLLRNLPGYVGRVQSECEVAGFAPDSFVGRAVARCLRMEAAATIAKAVENAQSSFNSAESYGVQWPSDAVRCYAEVINYYRQVMAHATHPYAAHVMETLYPLAASAESRIVELRAAMVEKEKATITAWIAGTSNIRPRYEAGAYARIVGDHVETSRGASVPIEHACRLSRVFDRIVASGGKDWPDGSGPMVGHYRVNRIGADGSLVIGCHEFSPDEARRLRDILAQCKACEGVQ